MATEIEECQTCIYYKEGAEKHHYNWCTRFPRPIAKQPTDGCGEYEEEK